MKRRSSSFVRYGYTESRATICKNESNPSAKSGHSTGLHRISSVFPLASRYPHHRNSTAAPISRMDSDQVSTAPCASTAKVNNMQMPARMVVMGLDGKGRRP